MVVLKTVKQQINHDVPLAPQSQRQCGLQNSSIPHLVTVRRSLIGVSVVQGKLNINSTAAASTVTENGTGSLRIVFPRKKASHFAVFFFVICVYVFPLCPTFSSQCCIPWRLFAGPINRNWTRISWNCSIRSERGHRLFPSHAYDLLLNFLPSVYFLTNLKMI